MQAQRDQNRVTSLMGVSSADGTTPLPVKINPATGRILISATISDDTSTQRVIVAKNGSDVGTREKINLIEGTGVTMTVADNVADNRVDVTINAVGGGSGTVTSVSVASANGFAGTVANATTTPAITITATPTGILKSNGTAISAATASTDYLVPSDIANMLETSDIGTLVQAYDADLTTWAGKTAPSGTVLGTTDTQTLTNKRITARTGTATSSATPTINTDNVDFYSLTAQAEDITSFTTNLSGTPTERQTLWIAITGTGARAITWGSSFEASTVALPTTTVSTNRLDVGFVWNTVTSKWRCIASA